MSLPQIPPSVTNPNLSSDQQRLFRHAETWLARNRHLAPGNPGVALANPRPSHLGVTCDVVRVTELNAELLDLFLAMSPDSTRITGHMDEEQGHTVYHVTIAYVQEEDSESFWSRFFNDPSMLGYALSGLVVSAAVTTSGERWRVLFGLVV